jgi:diguanylate cyclase (GGDEF)-like protein
MRLPHVRFPRRSRTGFLGGPSLIRIRLWLAMLGLAVLPMVGVIYLIGSFSSEEPPSGADLHAWETSAAAADLAAAERAIESRLLAVAADADVRRLVDGVDNDRERATAIKVISMLEMGDTGLIEGLCITRTLDGTKVPINVPAGSSTGTDACGTTSLVEAALAAPPGGVARGTSYGNDRTRRLIIATEIMGAARRSSGVVSAEISLRDLFAATPSAAGIGTSAALVDMASNTIVAGARTDAVVSGSDIEGTRPLGNLRVRLNGIVTGHEGTADALAAAGWTATAAPLFASDDGARFGLIHIWPTAPTPPADPLVFVLIGFALMVLLVTVVVARTFLQPFDDLAESQAQLEVLYREARQDSLHDGLTGLGNHRSFQEELDRQLDLFRRHQVPVALLLIDLDDLKVVNDNEGHPAGDQLLLGMANAIRDTLRYGDRAFRIGGDEFAVLLPHTDADEGLIAANRLRHFCLRPAAGDRVIPFSGGISAVPQLTSDRNELFRQADAALYRCKRGGRGTVAIFDADRDLVPEDPHGQGSSTAVRDIIRSRNLKPVYQPIVDLRDGSVLGFEGLIRPGASSPFANPGQLFAAAANAGRTSELDLACFEVVAAGAVDIDPRQVVTINLSPQTLELEDSTAAWLLEILARYGISPGRLIVELTEREAITDLDRLRRNVASLQRAGVRLAADDVGAGNAGLRLLSQVRFDIMKIDLSLVQDGAQHESSRAVLRSLMDLAARQGAIAIAEGLETAEQLRSLQQLGITTGQGYLLGRPGSNVALTTVDIKSLASGTVIVGGSSMAAGDATTAASASAVPPSALTTPPPAPVAGDHPASGDAYESTPA